MTRRLRPSWTETWLDVASTIAARSLCVRAQVGAVVVDRRQRVVATGYNGPPAGFQHDDRPCNHWCDRARPTGRWVAGADAAPLDFTVKRSTSGDPIYVERVDGREVGVIVDPHLVFAQAGWTYEEDLSPAYDDCPSLHAEANALSVCELSVRLGGTIYITGHVCYSCAKLVANSGLRHVVICDSAYATHRRPLRSYRLLEDCGLTVTLYDRFMRQVTYDALEAYDERETTDPQSPS